MTTKTETQKIQAPALRITRTDLIEQIMREANADLQKRVTAAKDDFAKKCQEFVNAVNGHALKLAQPAIRELRKLSDEKQDYEGSYKLEYQNHYGALALRHRNGEERDFASFEAETSELRVAIRNGNDHYSSSSVFYVVFKLPAELAKQKKAVDAAFKAHRDLKAEDAKRAQDKRQDVTQRMIRQAIDEMPEGKKLLKALADLRVRSEAAAPSPTLIPETSN